MHDRLGSRQSGPRQQLAGISCQGEERGVASCADGFRKNHGTDGFW
jgi:hypothetical protein